MRFFFVVDISLEFILWIEWYVNPNEFEVTESTHNNIVIIILKWINYQFAIVYYGNWNRICFIPHQHNSLSRETKSSLCSFGNDNNSTKSDIQMMLLTLFKVIELLFRRIWMSSSTYRQMTCFDLLKLNNIVHDSWMT